MLGGLLKLNKIKAIKNAWICLVENEKVMPIFGELHFKDGIIVDLIKQRKYETIKSKNHYDAKGKVVTIPLINFHDHIYSRLAKGLKIKGEMNSFTKILPEFWWKVDSALTKDMIAASAQMAAIESIKNGVTYIFDHHSSPNYSSGSLDLISKILKKNNLRGVLCFETSDRNGSKKAKEGIKENINFIKAHLNDSEIKSMFGMHASFTLTEETLKYIGDEVAGKDIGVHIHVAEDKADVEESIKRYKLHPIDRLIKYKLLNERSILAHGVHLKSNDLRKLSLYGVSIAVNIESNMNNSVGVHKFKNYPEDVSLLCGTDGMHANPASTFKLYFQMLRLQGFSFAEAFQRINKIYFDQISFVKKYFSDFSLLNVGQRADFIVWDYVPPTPITQDNFFGHLIYGILNRKVHSVFQKGKALMHEYKLQFINEAVVNRNIYSSGKKLFEYFNK